MVDWHPKKLQRIQQERQIKRPAQRLGNLVEDILQRLVYPRQKKLAKLQRAWEELLPEELLEHSRLDGIYRGQLRVLVDNAASLYEFNLLSGQELVGKLNEQFPGAKLARIKFLRGQWGDSKEEEI